jgi:acetolactate synthase-1/2/3 large subunit
MRGSQALIRTLVASGVQVCFSNPGTSEMHFVTALDDVAEMRAVLALFEGVATGAADGYARMSGRPAATLLHLGPGLGNGLANLHNARRARSPVVNIVGDHATWHRAADPPLASDIETVARNVSAWVRTTMSVADVARDAAAAVAAAMGPPGTVATLVLPADVSWEEGAAPAAAVSPVPAAPVPEEKVRKVADALRSGEPAVVLIGGAAMRAAPLSAANRVAKATGAKLFGETFPARLERGAGIVPVDRLAYFGEMAQAQLAGARHLVLVDALEPVSFFAYPGKPGRLTPEGCAVHTLAAGSDDVVGALAALADLVAHDVADDPQAATRPELPAGAVSTEAVAAAVGALLPDDAIVVDEGLTAGIWVPGATAGAPPHDWLSVTGGSIGQGLPAATGAAVACPDRPVLCLEGDGSAMYTIQALWTQAREQLDVTTIIFANGSYAILQLELGRTGAGQGGPKAQSMLEIGRPDLDFVALARGLGVPATRPDTAEQLGDDLARAFAEPGPHLIEAVV